MKKPLEEEETLLQDVIIETSVVNAHWLHSDGDMSRYFIDKDYKSV